MKSSVIGTLHDTKIAVSQKTKSCANLPANAAKVRNLLLTVVSGELAAKATLSRAASAIAP